jgi:hypothetical protein
LVALTDVLFRYLLERLMKTTKNPIQMIHVLAEIRTGYLQNMSLERYCLSHIDH